MKIGIYVGSFNPPHKGHIKIIKHLINKKYLDKIIVIPTGNYWDKQNLINIKDRINMLKLYENKNIEIDEVHNNLKYTYQVLREFSKIYDIESLYLIIGADNIIDFNKWKNYAELLTYNFIIINRDNIDIKYYLDKLEKKDKYKIVNDLELLNISSTDIRNKLKNGFNVDDILDEEIFSYLKNHNLENNF